MKKALLFWVTSMTAVSLGLPLAARAELSERQVRLLNGSCMQCHARPGLGAPLMGRSEDWRERASRGEVALLRSVVLGLRDMPPLGSCATCNEADFRAMVRWMAGLTGEKP